MFYDQNLLHVDDDDDDAREQGCPRYSLRIPDVSDSFLIYPVP
jgi:hypothetical protein